MTRRIAVTGGAGYIGSHTVRILNDQGFDVHVLDDLSLGHREGLDSNVHLHIVDLREGQAVMRLFDEIRPDFVMHFAAHCYVGESILNPKKYFEDNMAISLNVLSAMMSSGARYIVYSSSCATYGEPQKIPIPEEHPQDPVNPYGETKYFTERILRRYDEAYGIKYAILRYFNAAGAEPSGNLGESHDPETHLIPLMIRSILDDNYTLTVFGNDYDTPDGTCIRDYIHVLDLGWVHVHALGFLMKENRSEAFNVGAQTGFSILEMIQKLQGISGYKVKYTMGKRRLGDPAILIAEGDRAGRLLGWKCKYSSIETILETAWKWHQCPKF